MSERTGESDVGVGGHGRGRRGVDVKLPSEYGGKIRIAGRYYQQCQLRPSEL